jgi:hypothetical protein
LHCRMLLEIALDVTDPSCAMNDRWYSVAILIIHIYRDNSQIRNVEFFRLSEYFPYYQSFPRFLLLPVLII